MCGLRIFRLQHLKIRSATGLLLPLSETACLRILPIAVLRQQPAQSPEVLWQAGSVKIAAKASEVERNFSH